MLDGCLAWLPRRLGLAALLGALGGPLAYAGGARLGAVAFPAGLVAGLIAVGAAWLVATPFLAWMARPRAGVAHA
jgi:hypothetical protein